MFRCKVSEQSLVAQGLQALVATRGTIPRLMGTYVQASETNIAKHYAIKPDQRKARPSETMQHPGYPKGPLRMSKDDLLNQELVNTNARANLDPVITPRTVKALDTKMSSTTQPLTALISGHIDLSIDDFKKYYIPKIDAAVNAGHHFIMGDAPDGLHYLISPNMLSQHPNLKSRITVYPFRDHKAQRFLDQGLRVIHPHDPSLKVKQTICVVTRNGPNGRRYQHIQRDANMTAASDYDILYSRSEAESRAFYGHKYRTRISATEMNRLRRAELKRIADAKIAASSLS